MFDDWQDQGDCPICGEAKEPVEYPSAYGNNVVIDVYYECVNPQCHPAWPDQKLYQQIMTTTRGHTHEGEASPFASPSLFLKEKTL